MKLRNRQTGKIYTLSDIEYTQGGKIELRAIIPGGNMSYYYDSLDKLYHEWEDVRGPLIKDEKIRKVFRKWADLFGAEQFRVNHFSDSRRKTTSIGSPDSVTEPVIELPGHIGEDSEIYTKVELCGEEIE